MTSNPATVLTAPVGADAQPVSRMEWVPRDTLSANAWNPNIQAPPEYRLLETSILENGWTQPIVVRELNGSLEIVDGYHRWMTSGKPQVRALTDGLTPIVRLGECPLDLAMMATVRHNRAKGTHHVLSMADIVAKLADSGMEPGEIGRRLEMDTEEVDRLLDRGQMTKRGAAVGFSHGWTV